MKKSIVLDLQMLATESNVPISELLRKALLIASKLKLDIFKKWINCELHGYYEEVDVPAHRIMTAQVNLKNPYRGLIPFIISDPEISDMISKTEVRDPIESLADLLKNRSSDSYFIFPFSNNQQMMIMKMQGSYPMEAIRRISPNQVAAIIDGVRTKILEWTLELESNGILGDGLIFSDVERSKAVKTTSINIQNFQGVLGDIGDSGTVNQNMTQNISINNFSSLQNCLKDNGVSDNDIIDLRDAIVLDGTPTVNGKFGEKVSAWLGKMVSKSADGSWQIGLAVAGNILSEALGKFYGF